MTTEAEIGAEARYMAALRGGKFMIQRYVGTDKYIFPPREAGLDVGPDGSPLKVTWVSPKGTGTVYSTTIVRRKREAGGDYNVSLIELDEGVRMMSSVIGIPPSDVYIGLRVTAKVIERGGAHVVVYEPILADNAA